MKRWIVGISLYDKQDMPAWLFQGFAFNLNPERVRIDIALDLCSDETPQRARLAAKGILPGFDIKWHEADKEWREIGCHNAILRDMGDEFAGAIIFQDDQCLMRDIVADADAAMASHANVGIIGGRDGFDRGMSPSVSAQWSDTRSPVMLKHGECAPAGYLNSGPIIYPIETVRKVGLVCDEFVAMYAWFDYCARCRRAGLTNLVMGTDLMHKKFGKVTQTRWYTQKDSDWDRALLAKRVPEFR